MKKILLLLFVGVLSAGLFAETMHFDIQYLGVTWIKVGITHTESGNSGTIVVTGKSTSLAQSWAKMDNRYESRYTGDYLPASYLKTIAQKGYTEESTATYNRSALTARYQNRTKTGLPKTYRIEDDSRDFFSALFFLRDNPTATQLSIDANGLIYRGTVEHLSVETISTALGKLSCDKLKITFRQITPGERTNSDILTNNLVGKDRVLYFWISRDSRHAPVRAEYKQFPFSVVWKLQEFIP